MKDKKLMQDTLIPNKDMSKTVWVLERMVSRASKQASSSNAIRIRNEKIDSGAVFVVLKPRNDFKTSIKKPVKDEWWSAEILWTPGRTLQRYIGSPVIVRKFAKSGLYELQIHYSDKVRHFVQVLFDKQRRATIKEEEQWEKESNRWKLLQSV